MTKRLVVLASGRGSNLRAIAEACASGRIPSAQVVGVVSDLADVPALAHARAAGIPAVALPRRSHGSREDFEGALMGQIDAFRPDFVLLAGFMRLLSPTFVAHYAGRMVNIHPSLLPAFPGLHTHERALAAGVKLHGATVHFVTEDTDAGPVIIQGAVPVLDDDDPERLAARVLAVEHRIYPQAVAWLTSGRLVEREGRVCLQDGGVDGRSLIVPSLEGP